MNSTALPALAVEFPFDEHAYLAANPDVAAAVRAGQFATGLAHFRAFGKAEGRVKASAESVASARQRKMAALRPHLRLDLAHQQRGDKFDFLTDALRQETGIVDTDAVSANSYDDYGLDLIQQFRDGLVLDCGAGRRSVYYPNVVNFEIVDYDSTDVVGVGEHLPFADGTFDAVISIAVLEHVRDPFRCAAEIVRVLKPGGKLLCCVPFLQPVHGYPHHYYNMTPQGLRALFERSLEVDDQRVIDSMLPLWALSWIVKSWAASLEEPARQQFLSLPISTLLQEPYSLMEQPWVRGMAAAANFELACASLLFAHKPR